MAEVANELLPPVSMLIISTPSIASTPSDIALTRIPDFLTSGKIVFRKGASVSMPSVSSKISPPVVRRSSGPVPVRIATPAFIRV